MTNTRKLLAKKLNEVFSKPETNKTKVCEAAGISRMSLHGYLHGENSPSVEVVFKLADALGVSPGWLLGLDPEPTPTETALIESVDKLRVAVGTQRSKLQGIEERLGPRAISKILNADDDDLDVIRGLIDDLEADEQKKTN